MKEPPDGREIRAVPRPRTTSSGPTESERNTRAAHEHFRLVFEKSPLPMWVFDPQTLAILDVNQAAIRHYGYTRREFLARTLRDLRPPEDMPLLLASLEHAGEEPVVWTDFRHRRKDGTILHVEVATQEIRYGERPARLAIINDVTARKVAEEHERLLARSGQILASSLDYETTLQSVARLAVPALADYCMVHLVSESGEVRQVAAAHRDSAREALLHELEDLYQVDPQNAASSVGQVLRTGESILAPEVPGELSAALTMDERVREIYRTLAPRSYITVPLIARERCLGVLTFATSESGRHYGAADLVVAQELARHAALAVDNARLYERARQAIRARDEVLAIVSHDLRSPLNAITLSAETILELPLTEAEREKQIRVIERAAAGMDRLIQDLLDAAKLEANRLRLQLAPVAVAELLQEVSDLLGAQATEAGLHLACELEDGDAAVNGDRDRLLQVLSNLVSNALRVTPAGGSIRVEAAAAGEVVRFRVIDTGPGIPAEHLAHLFERFWQAPHSARHGAGLGLAIARGIVEAHGGSIEVESTVGRGSAFTFTIPLSDTSAGTSLPGTAGDDESR